MKRMIVAAACFAALTACAAEKPAAQKVEIVSTNNDRGSVEFLNTKIFDELKSPIFGGVVVTGTAEWHRAQAGYASSLKLVAQAVDAKGFSFDVNVNVGGELSDKTIAQTKLAAEAARKFAEDLGGQIAAKSREFAAK